MAVIEAFAGTEMAEGCSLLTARQAQAYCPMLRDGIAGALLSSADLRIESATAIPLLATWLEKARGVTIRRGVAASRIEPGRVHLSDGSATAATRIIACPGDDCVSLFAEAYAAAGITRCQLQMMRLAAPGWRLPHPVMSDLSMMRYLGYSELPEVRALRERLTHEEHEALGYGIHLIAVQGVDGSLVVGDSHAYAATPPPFGSAAVDDAILRQFSALFGHAPPIVQRWTGTYASGPEHSIVRELLPGVYLVVITSGTGASTSFALAEDVVSSIFGD